MGKSVSPYIFPTLVPLLNHGLCQMTADIAGLSIHPTLKLEQLVSFSKDKVWVSIALTSSQLSNKINLL